MVAMEKFTFDLDRYTPRLHSKSFNDKNKIFGEIIVEMFEIDKFLKN